MPPPAAAGGALRPPARAGAPPPRRPPAAARPPPPRLLGRRPPPRRAPRPCRMSDPSRRDALVAFETFEEASSAGAPGAHAPHAAALPGAGDALRAIRDTVLWSLDPSRPEGGAGSSTGGSASASDGDYPPYYSGQSSGDEDPFASPSNGSADGLGPGPPAGAAALGSLDDAGGGGGAAAGAAAGRAVYEALRIDGSGKTRRVYVRKRDLLRAHGLQPRDLRRVDPSLGPTKTSPSVAVREGCVLFNVGGVRALVTADRALLFEPESGSSRALLELVLPRVRASAAARLAAARRRAREGRDDRGAPERDAGAGAAPPERPFPFELEVLEGAFQVATARLERELVASARRVGAVLRRLPREITPANLEELRRVKQALVELESRAENLRDLLEELMDDEDEVRDLNLSARPAREERRRARERDRLEREMDAAAAGGAAAGGAAAYGDAAPPAAAPAPGGAARRGRRGARPDDDADDDAALAGAQDALAEMAEEEEEEREYEETEDLLEYYLQRAATTQSEAERLLAGARDLEESIGVSLSARRFEVNRLELLLSIASFAAALGAMVASIFGMNLRSTLEASVAGFWGTTAAIVAGCGWVFWVLYRYTLAKRIL